MSCDACGHENPDANRFCGGCGAPLTRACPACGHANPPDHRFCGACGVGLDAASVTEIGRRDAGSRKIVTIVFADLVGSTALHERLDAEAVRQFMEGYYAAMRSAVEAHGGRVTQLMGDGVKAVFGAPRVAEDDAIRAVRAAVEMQRAFRQLAARQRGRVGKTGLRVAVNTGEVVAEEGQEIIGDPVNVAARLQEQGGDGDVVVGGPTQRLVGSLVTLERLGTVTLKGRAEAVDAYRVVSLDAPRTTAAAEFVGREKELLQLNLALESAIDAPATKLAVLVASPGLGKSRLIAEFVRRLGDAATVLRAHCDAAGGSSFAPLAQALRDWVEERAAAPADAAGDVSEARIRAALESLSAAGEAGSSSADATTAERERIAAGVAALLAGSPASPEETFFVVRRLLASLASAKPVVLVIDDLHWGEPLLLDLVEHLVQWGGGVPVFVLVGARPELRDLRSSLLTPGGFVSDVVTLAGLDAGAATRLAANVIGAADLPAAVAAKVLATSEGNPLFVSELVRMLVEEGLLTREGGRWTAGAGLTNVEMPPTIQALLAARIERLRPEESLLLERAAVIGRHFSRTTLAALLPPAIKDLDARLESLHRSELIERDSGWLFGEPGLRFHHLLIRDAAYRRLLKGTRAELHERLADWIEKRVGGAHEHDETIGYHLELAHQHLGEIGPLDEHGKALGERAARRLAAAGRRALERDDASLAAGLLGRAVGRLAPGDAERAPLLLDWCEALLSAGEVGAAAEAIGELARFVDAGVARPEPEAVGESESRRLRAWHACFAGQLTVLTSPRELHDTAAVVAGAAEELAALGDVAGEAKAYSVQAQALARLGRVGACESALDRALAAARRAGDRRRANTVLAGAPLAALWGPSSVARASGRCLDVVRVLRITQGAPAVEAIALSCQAVLEALRGRADAAGRMLASSRALVEEVGIAHRLLETDVFAARVRLIEGDPAAAERSLTRSYRELRELGFKIDAARAAALLGRAILEQGRAAEAEALTHESEELAGDDLQAAIAWRGVRAEAMARRGQHAAALELARSAVDIAASTDALLDHADARMALAAALEEAGRSAEAATEERRAVDLWEAKGATLLCRRARAGARRNAAAPPPEGGSVELSGAEAAGAAAGDGSAGADARAGMRLARRVRYNPAADSAERFRVALEARDEVALRAVCNPRAKLVHHPTGSTYGSDEAIEGFVRGFSARSLVVADQLLATLGDSLALLRRFVSYEGARTDTGQAELDVCVVWQVDEKGRAQHVEVFEANRLGVAVVRLYERYADLLAEGAGGARAAAVARSGRALLNMTDIDRIATALDADIQSVDHRNVGYGNLRGAGEALISLRALIDLAQDIAWRADDVLGLRPDGLLLQATTTGTDRSGGGTFERDMLILLLFGEAGLIARWEQFDVAQRPEALARFDVLLGDSPATPTDLETTHSDAIDTRPAGASAAPAIDSAATSSSPRLDRHGQWVGAGSTGQGGSLSRSGLEIPPNRASATSDRQWRLAGVGDWEGLRALCAPNLEYEDRRRLLRSSGDRDTFLASMQISAAPGIHLERELLATPNDRLSLEHRRFTRTEQVVLWEVESLSLTEIDEQGRIAVVILFDAEDRLAADEELAERAWRIDAETLPSRVARFYRALYDRDLAGVRAALPDDLVYHDRRRIGLGRIEGAGAYVASLAALLELTADARVSILHHIVAGPHGLLSLARVSGTNREGGVFESVFLLFQGIRDGWLACIEFFDPEDVSVAGARFDEWCAALPAGAKGWTGKVPIPPNEATRALDRIRGIIAAGDMTALADVVTEDFEYDDRTRQSLVRGGLETWKRALAFLVAESGARFEEKVVAAVGERLVLHRVVLREGGRSATRFESESLRLTEIDGSGKLRALVLFDPEDHAAASDELLDRYLASGADGAPSELVEVARAWNRHDLEAVRQLLPDDFYLHDHKRTGVGRLNGAAAYLDSIAALFALSPDIRVEILYFVAIAEHGRVYVSRWWGTDAGGGAFEAVHVVVALLRGGKPAGMEIFEIDDLEAARARFAEFGAGRR